MIEKFKIWSETNSFASRVLAPDFGLRDWDTIKDAEKLNLLEHLYSLPWDEYCVCITIAGMNLDFRVRSVGQVLLKHGGPHDSPGMQIARCCIDAAIADFARILKHGHQEVVLEFISRM